MLVVLFTVVLLTLSSAQEPGQGMKICVCMLYLFIKHRTQHFSGGERWNKGQVMRGELDHTVFYFLKIESLGFEGTVVVKLNFICQ